MSKRLGLVLVTAPIMALSALSLAGCGGHSHHHTTVVHHHVVHHHVVHHYHH